MCIGLLLQQPMPDSAIPPHRRFACGTVGCDAVPVRGCHVLLCVPVDARAEPLRQKHSTRHDLCVLHDCLHGKGLQSKSLWSLYLCVLHGCLHGKGLQLASYPKEDNILHGMIFTCFLAACMVRACSLISNLTALTLPYGRNK